MKILVSKGLEEKSETTKAAMVAMEVVDRGGGLRQVVTGLT